MPKRKQLEKPPSEWTPPPLLDFFNGVHDRVLASFTGSRRASSATKGNIRESALTEIERSLPSIVRIHRGDIIDSHGGHTGQLDGIVVHVASPAVALSGQDRIVLAEGALAVLEVKSNLRSQWSEVMRTWEKLREIRRPLSQEGEQAKTLLSRGDKSYEKAATLGLHEQSVPFFVVGWKGWNSHGKLQEKVLELAGSFGKGPRPQLFVGQLTPPAFAMLDPTCEAPEVTADGRPQYGYRIPLHWVNDPGLRGLVLMNLWRTLSERGRHASLINIDWKGYMRTSTERGSLRGVDGRDSTR